MTDYTYRIVTDPFSGIRAAFISCTINGRKIGAGPVPVEVAEDEPVALTVLRRIADKQ